MNGLVYLDNSAATRCCDRALQLMNEAAAQFGNPSSLHGLGLEAEDWLTRTRRALAAALGASADEIGFTSGGTESNNLALFGAVSGHRRGHIVAGATEHDSVLEPLKQLAQRGFTLTLVPPDASGVVSAERLTAALTAETVLVCLMAVNNETGAIQQAAFIRRALQAAGARALIHCDAVGALGKQPVTAAGTGADLISLSAHKMHGIKGAGALYIKKGVRIPPLLLGGSQERGRRAGTEAVPAIAGWLGALEEMDIPKHAAHAQMLKARLLAGLPAVNGRLNAETDFPYLVNISIPGYKSETMLHFLNSRGIYVSSGSACAKGKRSHVLQAQGLVPDRADSALRISFSRYNTAAEVDALLEALGEMPAHIAGVGRTIDRKS